MLRTAVVQQESQEMSAEEQAGGSHASTAAEQVDLLAGQV